jgi:hypothetical protein
MDKENWVEKVFPTFSSFFMLSQEKVISLNTSVGRFGVAVKKRGRRRGQHMVWGSGLVNVHEGVVMSQGIMLDWCLGFSKC